MAYPENQSTDDRQKLIAALQRAIPVTRMVDYGVPVGDALEVHARTTADVHQQWDEVCEELAHRHMKLAEEAQENGHRLTSAQAWRSASALLQCGQLAFNADSSRKKALYEQAQSALDQHGQLAGDLDSLTLQTTRGSLYGWLVRPAVRTAEAAVIVIGGLSGWGGTYLDMGRALAARGMLAILAEGPGQGLSRMRDGIDMCEETLPLLQRFVDHAYGLPASRIGVWGNSFGGLLAARMAASDERVQAVCINGAPITPDVPTFRTAREQMSALFGTSDEHALAQQLAMLSLQAPRDRITGSMLVVQGGRDELAPLGTQQAFFTLAQHDRTRLMTWLDGEHTIYNHAQERNALVADWFAKELDSQGD